MVSGKVVAVIFGLVLIGTGIVGFAATTVAPDEVGLRPCGSSGGDFPNSPTDPLCPLVVNACNDPDGCSACVFSPCMFYVHYPQKRCTWWARLHGCTDSTYDWCYLVFYVPKDECGTFDPSQHPGEGDLMGCEAHCSQSTGHPCNP